MPAMKTFKVSALTFLSSRDNPLFGFYLPGYSLLVVGEKGRLIARQLPQ